MKKKVNSQDYIESMLPKTRKEVFFDVLKLHFFDLLKIGFISVLFIFPLLFFITFKDQYVIKLNYELANASNENDIIKLKGELLYFKNITSFIIMLCLIIYSIFFAGFTRVIRQYCWEENVYFKSDFKKGIKDNKKQMIILFLFIGIIYSLENYLYNYYVYTNNALYNYLFIVTICFTFFVIIPIFSYCIICIPIYDNKLLDNMKISMLLYVKNPFKTWKILLPSGILFFLNLIPNIYTHIIFLLLSFLFIPYSLLAYSLHSYDILDKDLNTYKHQEIVNKGLYMGKDDKNEN